MMEQCVNVTNLYRTTAIRWNGCKCGIHGSVRTYASSNAMRQRAYNAAVAAAAAATETAQQN